MLKASDNRRIALLSLDEGGLAIGRKTTPSPRQIKEALRRRYAGEPIRDIARTYNVSHSTISRWAIS